MVKATIANAYPKIPKDKREKNLRNIINKFDKGKATAEDLEQAYVATIERVVKYQNDAGLDLVTDGQIRWDDPLVKFTDGVKNLNRGGLLRYFDNNTYYRRSTVDGELKFEKSVFVDDYKLCAGESAAPVKVIMPAPYTFSTMVEDNYYYDQQRLIEALCDILREEISELEQAGCKVIQLEDPVLQANPEAIEWASYWFNRAVEDFDLQFWLAFYFGKFSAVAEKINDFKADCIAVDVVSHPEDFEIFCNLDTDKERCFGLLDARDIKMEDENKTIERMKKIDKAVSGREFCISTSASLEFLPPKEAFDKLLLLGKLKETFNKGA